MTQPVGSYFEPYEVHGRPDGEEFRWIASVSIGGLYHALKIIQHEAWEGWELELRHRDRVLYSTTESTHHLLKNNEDFKAMVDLVISRRLPLATRSGDT